MFQSVRKYLYERRRGIAKFAGFVGGAYLVGHYALQRLEETREKILQDRTAKENLKRRFQQNQQDCVFTTLALVPGLGNQILEELDVEGLTLQLQQLGSNSERPGMGSSFTSTASQEAGPGLASQQTEPRTDDPPKVPLAQTGTTEPEAEETRTDVGSSIITAIQIGSSQSWIREFNETQADDQTASPTTTYLSVPETPLTADEDSSTMTGSVVSATEGDEYSEGAMGESAFTHLRASEATESFENSSQSSPRSDHFRRSPAPSPSPPPATPKTKMELWRELKLTTFVRSITILYSLVLLTLTTHVQLNILASHKYVQSVIEMELEEKEREEWGSVLGNSILGGATDMFFGSSTSGMFGGRGLDAGEGQDDALDRRNRILRLSDMTSRKFLTMNWWLLNVGWKNVMEKVQSAVEDVFAPVPLKAQLTIDTLRQHIESIRQKVEYENLPDIPGDGELTVEEQECLQGATTPASVPQPMRTDFLPSLLPLTRAAEQHVLVQGGIPPEVIFSYDEESKREEETLRFLLDYTKSMLSSKDFEIVLGKALSWATEQFLMGMERECFDGDDGDEQAVQTSLRLAALLPGVTRWSHLAVNALPNELIDGVANLPEVNALSAIIFASYEDSLRNM